MTQAVVSVDANVRQHRATVTASRGSANGDAKATSGKCGRSRAGRDGHRWATLNGFVDAVLATATEAEVRVWLVLYRDVKPGGLARVGMTDIARRAGLTRRAVVKAVGSLKQRRLIEVVSRGSINGTTNVYRLHSTGG